MKRLKERLKIKLRFLWQAIRGKPVIYGVHFTRGLELAESQDLWVCHCQIENTESLPTYSLL